MGLVREVDEQDLKLASIPGVDQSRSIRNGHTVAACETGPGDDEPGPSGRDRNRESGRDRDTPARRDLAGLDGAQVEARVAGVRTGGRGRVRSEPCELQAVPGLATPAGILGGDQLSDESGDALGGLVQPVV